MLSMAGLDLSTASHYDHQLHLSEFNRQRLPLHDNEDEANDKNHISGDHRRGGGLDSLPNNSEPGDIGTRRYHCHFILIYFRFLLSSLINEVCVYYFF